MFKGERILICQPMMFSFTGSAIATIELAEYFMSIGWEVTVYTNLLDYPISDVVKEKNIKVVCFDGEDASSLSLCDYDIVWVHSQILPKSIIEELTKEHKKYPAFIFLHMSSADYCADERAWVYGLENALSDKTLVISERVEGVMRKYVSGDMDFYRNPAPECFVDASKKRAKKIEKILLVSNHPPEELVKAIDILDKEYCIKCERIGIDGKYELIRPEKLKQYDVVVTIGKTVQYCLVMGIPAYVYDVFGGDGYLNKNNIRDNEKVHFSGLNSEKKLTPDDLAKDIVERFGEGYEYVFNEKQYFKKRYSISNSIKNVLSDLKPKKKKIISREYADYLLLAQDLARHCIFYPMYIANRKTIENKNLKSEIRKLESDISTIKSARSYKMIEAFGRITRRNKRK